MTKGIIGAVIGDIAGSTREFRNVSSKRFKLLTSESTVTDDSVLTMAIAEWMLDREHVNLDDALLKWGHNYPHAGYGRGFRAFLSSGQRNPQGSTHNGSAMRVSPVGFLASSYEEAVSLARESALPSHNTPGAIKGAQALTAAIWMARSGASKEEIRTRIEAEFSMNLSMSYDEVRDRSQSLLAMRSYNHDYAHEQLLAAESTVPMALTAFLEAQSYEEAIRLAIYLGGDSDTLACMAGAVASAFWGVPDEIVSEVLVYLPSDMIRIINAVDGTAWKTTGVSPTNARRWSINDIVVYGSNQEETDGEQGFFDVRPTRFHHHFNEGYPIITIGKPLDHIVNQIITLRGKVLDHPERRYIIREVGIGKAGFDVSQIAPLFSWAVGLDNVLLPKSFHDYLSAQ